MKQIKKRGFTLVELVIVIAVIAILAAVLIPTFITVIDNANNSADLQLVRNMNTVLSTNLEIKENATAENLRKLLKDNGIESKDLVTKNDDMVIVYNKATNQFERVNLKKTFGKENTSGEIVAIAATTEQESYLEEHPYSPEEVLKDRIITSTGGNSFAEALYSLHTMTDDFNMTNFFSKLNTKVKGKIQSIISSTGFVVPDGDGGSKIIMFQASSGSSQQWTMIEGKTVEAAHPTGVTFNETITEVNVELFANFERLTVVLPDTVETVTRETEQSFSSEVNFAGNVDALRKGLKADDEILQNNVLDQTLDNVKLGVASLGGAMAQSYFYVDTSKATDEEKFLYHTIQEAIDRAKEAGYYSNKEKTVVLTNNRTAIDEDLIIPKNVTLSVPHSFVPADKTQPGETLSGKDSYYLGHGYSHVSITPDGRMLGGGHSFGSGEKSIVDDDNNTIHANYSSKTYKQFSVTLAAGKSITVEAGGKLVVGGITSYYDQNYQGHTSNNYAQIDISSEGQITIEEGGRLECYGYIKGGAVNIAEGGSAIEPFIVTDFTGGSNCLSLYQLGQSPFLRYAMVNIQSTLTVNYGGQLWAHCNLKSGAGYNTTDEVVIGYGDSNSTTKGLITLEKDSDSKVVCTYKFTKNVTGSNELTDKTKNDLMGDLGRTTVQIYGKARTESLSLLGMVSTASVLFPVPFNFNFEIFGEMSIHNHYVILPGAEVTVQASGTLTVAKDSTLYVMDYLKQGAQMSGGKFYPTEAELKAAGLNTYGSLTVDGKFEVAGGAEAGGIIRTEKADATLTIGDADLSGKFNIGGVGTYDANTSSYLFPLRVFDIATVTMSDEDYRLEEAIRLVNVVKNSTYQSDTTTEATVKDQTPVTYYVKYSASSSEATNYFTAAGQQYYEKTESAVETSFAASFAFRQTGGYAEQVGAFKALDGATGTAVSDFSKAAALVEAYYGLSPAARNQVKGSSGAGFEIGTYNETKMTDLFKAAYQAAFAEGAGLDKALAAYHASQALEKYSEHVTKLVSEKEKNAVKQIGTAAEMQILFTVSYKTSDASKYTDVDTSFLTLPEGMSLQDYTSTEGDMTVIYFMASMAPTGIEVKDTNQQSCGTPDPAGTLLYAAWNTYVGHYECFKSDTGGTVTSMKGIQNIDVTFTLYSDISLLFARDARPADENKTQWTQFSSYCNPDPSLDIDRNSNQNKGFEQPLHVAESQKVTFDLNGYTVTFASNTLSSGMNLNGSNVQSQLVSVDHDGTLTIKNGTFEAENLPMPSSPSNVQDSTHYYIQSLGELTVSNLVLCTYNTNALAQKSLSLNGIRSYYVDEEPDGIFGPGHPAYYGDLTVNGLTIQGDVYGVGIAIEGGSAQIDNANIYAQTGIKVTATATEGGKGVQIKNTTVKTCFGQAVKLNATKDIQIDTIEGCKFYGSYDSDKALDITSTAGTTITINKIVDSSFVSPGTAIFVKGASDAAKVTIKEITDCVLAGDRAALNGTGNPATVGLDLQAYAVVEKMMNCTVVASTTNNKATALSVGANCSLNLVCAGEDNNWFAAEGNGESKLFVGSGTVTVQVGTGSPSDGVSATDFDISNTPANFSSATEFHGGYDCYKLVIPKESA